MLDDNYINYDENPFGRVKIDRCKFNTVNLMMATYGLNQHDLPNMYIVGKF